MKRTVLCGALGGVALCFPLSFVSFLPYLSIENMKTMLGALIGLGGIAVAAVLLYKNRSFKHAVLRTVIMFACCIIVFRCNSCDDSSKLLIKMISNSSL